MSAPARAENSTNVRAKNPAADGSLPWLRRGVGVLQVVAPEAAARAAVHLFFRTQRIPARADTAPIFRAATRFEVSLRGERIAAWSWGEGKTILLVHGWNGRATQLAHLVEPLVASGHRVVAFDHLGHGSSTGSSTTLVEMASAITAVARAAGGAYAIIAHSLGAASTVLALHEGLAVERAILIAPPVTPDPWFAQFSAVLGLDGETAALARVAAEAHVGRRFAELHVPTLASTLRQAALIIHDRDDREVPLSAGEAVASAWGGARLVVTEGLGHKRVLRAPEVLDAIRAFVTTQRP